MIKRIKLFVVVASLLLMSSLAKASVITVADWFIDGIDDGSAEFRVTEVFTSAAELGGPNNRYQYSFENLTTNLIAKLFRISNSAGAARDSMTGPSSWTERVAAPNFIWETSTPGDFVGPGESLFGLTLFTPDILPSLTSPPLGLNEAGWIQTEDLTGARVDVYGQLPRDGSSTIAAHAPTSILLIGLGLIALFLRGKR